MIPGEVMPAGTSVILYEGLESTVIDVINTGDRPVQVGSHFHFAETNEALHFDRSAARGQHLGVPAGTSVRFEPGVTLAVELVPFTEPGWLLAFAA